MTLIEDSIIAYFDKRLSDAERADLLQQVSANSAHRKLFQQHEAIRNRIYRAQLNVAVAPVVEAKLLSTIAALQQHPAPFVPRPMHFPIGAFASVLVAIVSTLYLVAPTLHSFSGATDQRRPMSAQLLHSSEPSKPNALMGATAANSSSIDILATHLESGKRAARWIASDAIQPRDAISTNSEAILPAYEAPSAEENISRIIAPREISIAELPAKSAIALHVNRDRDWQTESPKFECSLIGANGGVYPTGIHHLWDLGGVGISGGYFVGPGNLVGLRVSASRARNEGNQFPIRPDSASFATRLSAELYVEHRELLFNGKLIVTGALGAGLIQRGNLLSAEVGIRIPVSSRIQLGVAYSLSRTHSAEPAQYFDIARNLIETRSPNSINSRLLYGLSYSF
jgi:hypothetical protein